MYFDEAVYRCGWVTWRDWHTLMVTRSDLISEIPSEAVFVSAYSGAWAGNPSEAGSVISYLYIPGCGLSCLWTRSKHVTKAFSDSYTYTEESDSVGCITLPVWYCKSAGNKGFCVVSKAELLMTYHGRRLGTRWSWRSLQPKLFCDSMIVSWGHTLQVGCNLVRTWPQASPEAVPHSPGTAHTALEPFPQYWTVSIHSKRCKIIETRAQKGHAFLGPEFILNSFKPIYVLALMGIYALRLCIWLNSHK